MEGRVTKKLSQEFSKTESRILGALSKLEEFLLNPQVRTCSVAVQGTSGNANSENRETHGDRSSNDPYPEVGYFPHHSGQLNSPEAETNSHMVTETYPHSSIWSLTRDFLGEWIYNSIECVQEKRAQIDFRSTARISASAVRFNFSFHKICWILDGEKMEMVSPITTIKEKYD